MSDNTVVVGAHKDSENGSNSGSIYVYKWNGSSWDETKLLASDGAAGDFFGYSLSVSGDKAIVGAYIDADNGLNSGSAYIFNWNGSSWIETKLLASDGAAADYFGFDVTISGDTAIVGAKEDADNGSKSGSAYI
jgi:hypothetical protein